MKIRSKIILVFCIFFLISVGCSDNDLISDNDVIIGFTVQDINGPSTIDEGETAVYSIQAESDTQIYYKWACDPLAAGVFASWTSPATTFTASSVVATTDVTIRVTVDSINYPSEIRERDIRIVDVDP